MRGGTRRRRITQTRESDPLTLRLTIHKVGIPLDHWATLYLLPNTPFPYSPQPHHVPCGHPHPHSPNFPYFPLLQL